MLGGEGGKPRRVRKGAVRTDQAGYCRRRGQRGTCRAKGKVGEGKRGRKTAKKNRAKEASSGGFAGTGEGPKRGNQRAQHSEDGEKGKQDTENTDFRGGDCNHGCQSLKERARRGRQKGGESAMANGSQAETEKQRQDTGKAERQWRNQKRKRPETGRGGKNLRRTNKGAETKRGAREHGAKGGTKGTPYASRRAAERDQEGVYDAVRRERTQKPRERARGTRSTRRSAKAAERMRPQRPGGKELPAGHGTQQAANMTASGPEKDGPG